MRTLATKRLANVDLIPYVGSKALSEHQMILVSNRGPVEFQVTPAGELRSQRGCGGLVTALGELSRFLNFTWVAAALSEGDLWAAKLASQTGWPLPQADLDLQLRLVDPKPKAFEQYYNVFSNPFLWFVQHSMSDRLLKPYAETVLRDAWQAGYLPVNESFADAVIDVARRDRKPALVMLHDYHLYMAPAFIRRNLPNAILQHFVHIPWPETDVWQAMPRYMVQSICRSLLANDIVGFQTLRSAENFMLTCERYLESVRLDNFSDTVAFGQRLTQVRSYPISIDVGALRETLATPEVQEYRERLKGKCGEKTIVRVDRLDLSKNIVAGFQAFECLLERRSDLVGKVRFLAFLVPSRTSIPEYRAYADEVMTTAERINGRYGNDSWQPIEIFYENNYLQAVAAMTLYDVLLVNPLADGMNLVSKEGPIANQKDGVLVLSDTAGAYDQLQPGVLTVRATDIEETATALATALELPPARRSLMVNYLRSEIEHEDLSHWLATQLADIENIMETRRLNLAKRQTFAGLGRQLASAPHPVSV